MSTLIAEYLSDGTTSTPLTTIVNGSVKAWVNFNGTGTVAIRASSNVSSITDNGAGNYSPNWASSFSDSSYAVVSTGTDNITNYISAASVTTISTSSCTSVHKSSNHAGYDSTFTSLMVIR